MRSLLLASVFAALLGLAGCSHPIGSNSSAEPGTAPAPSFNQFTDIALPDGARMNADRTLLLGQGDTWVGRLVFSVRWTNAPEIFDFYKSEMPKFHWQEISSVRAAISVMTYQRANRIATVQIEDTTLGAEVILTMGPANGSGGGAAAGQDQPPPVAPAPQQPITTTPLK